MNFHIIDLAKNNDYLDEFQRILKVIEQSNDSLKSNYKDLNPCNFERFTAVLNEGKIIAFGGLQIDNSKWFNGTARAITRTWRDNSIRISGSFANDSGAVFRHLVVPDHLEHAKKIGLQTIFITREKTPNAFANWISGVNETNQTNFEILPNQYNVCGNICPIPASCKQWVAIHEIVPGGKENWRRIMNEFQQLNVS